MAKRQAQPSRMSEQTMLMYLALGVLVIAGGGLWVSVQLGYRMAGITPVPSGFWDTGLGVLKGTHPWPTESTVVAVAWATILATVAILMLRRFVGRGDGKSRVDRQAGLMGQGRDIEDVSHKSAMAKAERMGVTSPGVPVGRTVRGNKPLFGSWEDMHVDIWGPRTGKTTSRAIPAILEAPGAVITTSNKRDVVDATRGIREEAGHVWVFDPQQVVDEPASWWWNPLSYVTDEVKAMKLVEHFVAGSREEGQATGDAFWTNSARNLLRGFILAAALDDRPITDVYRWLARPSKDEAVGILEDHGYGLQADEVDSVISSPDKQRAGVFGHAQTFASCLTTRAVRPWIEKQGDDDERPMFDPVKFVEEGNGTLYSLSLEGEGSSGPLVTALTVAVVEAAEEKAKRSKGGRLPTPLLAVLDEAANVCRWARLPQLYSHYGSRGIVIMTILQSWSQGCDVWGESGMKKLWSAANIKVYGGGVSETAFLKDLSDLIGPFDRRMTSVSHTKGQATVSDSLNETAIMDVADLGALPRGRAVVVASGARPTMVAPQPWMAGPHAEAVKASIRRFDPASEATLEEVAHEADEVRDEVKDYERTGGAPL